MCNQCEQYTTSYCPRRKYGFFGFLGDSFMVIFTFGFWLIWIFVREMRNKR